MEFQHGYRNWNLHVETNNCGKLFFLKKVNPMSFVGIRAKRSRFLGKVFRQGCELCNICAQSQFFNICFVFFIKQNICSIELSEKDCLEVFRGSPTCTEERLQSNKILKEI